MKTLFEAIESGDVGEVWQAVKAGAALDEIDGNTEMTPLALAAEAGHTEIVRILLAAEADANLGGATTPLEAAVVEGHIETVAALLEAGADVNLAVEDGFTPLMTASATGDLRLVRCLLDAGARPRKTNDDGDTAISLAQEEGHDAVVKLLRSRSRRRKAAPEEPEAPAPAPESSDDAATSTAGDEPRDSGDEATTPKPEASSEGTDEETRPPSAEDGESSDSSADRTAPAAAAASPDSEPTEASPDEPSPVADSQEAAEDSATGGSAQEEPSEDRESEPEQSPPVAEGPAADARPAPDADSETPVEPEAPPATSEPPAQVASHRLAESKVMIEKLEILKKRIAGGGETLDPSAFEGLDLEEPDTAGYRPLMAAAYFGELEIVEALLEGGVEIDATDRTDSGLTALAWAAQSESPRRFEVLSALARAGAELDRRCGHNQRTALMHAAAADVGLDRPPQERFAATTRHLIELGAQTEITDRRGLTVWRLMKRDALGARTSTVYRRRLHQMLRVLEYCGARPIASHAV